MKKRILFILLALLSVIILTGCKKEVTNNAMTHISFEKLADVSDGADTGYIIIPLDDVVKEYPYEYYDEEAPKEAKATVFGKTYKGTYKYTERTPIGTSVYSRKYYDEKNKFEFSIDDNGRVVYFGNDKDYVDFGIAKTESACLKIANDLVSGFASPDDYKIEIEYKDTLGAYRIHYTKTVSGFATYDDFAILIYSNGKTAYFFSCNPGMIDKNAVIDIDREEVEAEVIGIALRGERKKDARIKDSYLTILPDGRPAIQYDVAVTYETLDGKMATGELLSFYVVGKGE